MNSGQHLPVGPTDESPYLAEDLAPSTNEDLRRGEFAPHDVLVSQRGLDNIEEKVRGCADKLTLLVCQVYYGVL